MASLMKSSRPKVTIELAGQETGSVPSYTTWDRIRGIATVEADHDTCFDSVEFTLQGTVQSSVPRASAPGVVEAVHTLLKIRQTVDDADYPTPRILKSGHTYQFPFTFIVPDRLPPQVCEHLKTSIRVEHAHTLLPPSLGDPMIASNGRSLLDDMCPKMCRVSYIVRVDILKSSLADEAARTPLVSVGKKVRIFPAVEEAPPLDVSDHKDVYWDRKEKNVRGGLTRTKFGRITAEASQPRPIYLSRPNSDPGDSIGTVATVQLRFEPKGDEEPPRLKTLSSKLCVTTIYSDGPMEEHPSLRINPNNLSRAAYYHRVPLSTMCVASASWAKHTITRRNSVQSRASCQSSTSSSVGTGATYYTASITVPVTLPKNKAFVPTFDTCLISRLYALDLDLSYTNILTPSISLRIPVQLACQQKVGDGTRPPPPLDDIKEEIDDIFSPRSISPPSLERTGHAYSPEDALSSE